MYFQSIIFKLAYDYYLSPSFTELRSEILVLDIWAWVSLAISIYVLYGVKKMSATAIAALCIGLAPAMFMGFIYLVGWIFRQI